MRRLNLAFFMNVGTQLDTIADYAILSSSPDNQKASASRARDSLQILITYDLNPMQLPASSPEVSALITVLNRVIQSDVPDASDINSMWMQAYKLNTILQGEMAVQAVYHIWPKRAFDTNKLVFGAISVFPDWVAQNLNDVEKYDIDQAGKCLAFETPTAAAFHLLRMMDSVIRRYYAVVVGAIPKPKMRNWGTYLKYLKECGADPKAVFAIEEIKDLYRNPIVHPEAQLSLDEALSLLGIVESAVTTMHADIVVRARETLPLLQAQPF